MQKQTIMGIIILNKMLIMNGLCNSKKTGWVKQFVCGEKLQMHESCLYPARRCSKRLFGKTVKIQETGK